MNKLAYLLTVFMLWSSIGWAQKCKCKGLVNVQKDIQVVLLDGPNGYPMGFVSSDTEKEAFITFNLLEVQQGFFKVDIGLSTEKTSTVAWIKFADYLGTYASNYSGSLTLYSTPSTKSATSAAVKKYYPDLYTIIDCQGTWVKVRLDVDGKRYEGWLSPDRQCANPYTNCN